MCVNSALMDLQSLSPTPGAWASISHSLGDAYNAAANVFCDEFGYIRGQHVRHICEFSCKFFVFFVVPSDYLRRESNARKLDKAKNVASVTVTYLCQIQTGD